MTAEALPRAIIVSDAFIVHDGLAALCASIVATAASYAARRSEYSAPAYCLWYLARKASKDGCCAEKLSVASEKERSIVVVGDAVGQPTRSWATVNGGVKLERISCVIGIDDETCWSIDMQVSEKRLVNY